MKGDSGHVLTVYYSYSGNTRKVARAIHQVVGGDLVEVQPAAPYPRDYNELVGQARRELDTGALPELKERIASMAPHDTVFVGSPNWLQTIAPPVLAFLSEADLAGKTIIPFITHGGGGLGRSALDIAGRCPDANVVEGLAVYGADTRAAQKWLAAHWPPRR